MPRIEYIAGADEVRDRSREVTPAPFFNPLLMTEGQAYLTLMRDQVATLRQYYPDRPIYRKALTKIDNAIHAGVHGPAPFVGAVEPSLYPVMRAIQIYRNERQPAVRPKGNIGSWASQSMVAGAGRIGAGEIPTPHHNFSFWWLQNDRAFLEKFIKNRPVTHKDVDALVSALTGGAPIDKDGLGERYNKFLQKYNLLNYVVRLYNDKIDKFAHHPLYNFLPESSGYPAAVVTKNILHKAGVETCAGVGDFSLQNMGLWVRNGILRSNITGGAGAISPEDTIFQLIDLPGDQYAPWLKGKVTRVDRPNVHGGPAIGNPAVIVPIIIAAIGAAATIATALIEAKQNNAFASVQGWGTNAYAAGTADWADYQESIQAQQQSQTGNWVPLAAAGVAAFLLLK